MKYLLRTLLILTLVPLLASTSYSQSGLPVVVVMPSAQSSVAFTPCYIKGGTGTLADTTNHANCKATPGNFYGFRAINTSATLAYLKMYDLATDPTCSSATGFIESIPIPASATGAGAIEPSNSPIAYAAGIAYCVTGGSASTDNSAPPAGVFITLKTK